MFIKQVVFTIGNKFQTMSTPDHYDIAIIGGGLAGLTLTCLLGKMGLSVICVDQGTKALPKNAELRTTVISYGSMKVLERAGIREKLKDQGGLVEDIKILDGSSSVLLEFLSAEAEGKIFGWNLMNTDLRTAMMEVIAGYKNAEHRTQTKIKDFALHEDHVECMIEGGETIKASLVLGADGRGSFTRKWMGVRTRTWDYNQRAIICNVTHENPHNNVAVEHFWPEGPFAALPMADDAQGKHRSSVVFTEHGPERKSLMHYGDEAFEAALATRFPARYGKIKVISPRAAYPLTLIHAVTYIGPRMALVADAAHGIHPIAGQGLNLGFRDINEITKLIEEAYRKGEDIGADKILQTYQRRRMPDNMAMIALTDSLTRLFSNNIPPIRFVRRTSLKVISKLPMAKRFLMKQAMGDR